jgi:hypothetical protein
VDARLREQGEENLNVKSLVMPAPKSKNLALPAAAS